MRDVLYLNAMQGSGLGERGWSKQAAIRFETCSPQIGLLGAVCRWRSGHTPINVQKKLICTVDIRILAKVQAFAGDCRVVSVVRPKGLVFRYCRFPVPTLRTVSKEQGCSDCVLATAKL